MITLRQYAAGETIIREDEVGESAFVIERGRVEVTKSNAGRKVHVVDLETGATFGEMAMVDDMPRSATVTAIEETVLREIHRDELFISMKHNPDLIVKLLNNLFERLREANMLIAQLTASPQDSADPGRLRASLPAAWAPERPTTTYQFAGLTDQAVDAMGGKPFLFHTFPIKIGRRTEDPLVTNHVEILDRAPLQISRHHVTLILEDGKIGAVDRGSQLGAIVDGEKIGAGAGPGPVFFKPDGGILILGTKDSKYQYRVHKIS